MRGAMTHHISVRCPLCGQSYLITRAARRASLRDTVRSKITPHIVSAHPNVSNRDPSC